MRRVAIIQARVGSTRLPRKVLADIAGRPMLAHVIARVRAASAIDDVVVATTDQSSDDEVAALALQHGARVFRGSETDVLQRYVGAARAAEADLVVRVTADCPLLDPAVVDRVVEALCDPLRPADYASNVIERTFPRGLDAEALHADVLERVHRLALSPAAREHVTAFILREQPSLFLTRSVRDAHDNSDLRWTVDEPADLEIVRAIYAGLDMQEQRSNYREVLAWARQHPDVATANAHVKQKF